MDNFTALIIPLEDHAEDVQRFRRIHVHKPGVRLPPHVSVIYPFVSSDAITESVREKLASLAAAHLPFDYHLRCIGRFDDARVLFLVPEPSDPFFAMFRAIRNAFPEVVPTFPDPVMHMTLAQEDPRTSLHDLESEFHAALSELLPIRTTARRLDLWEKKDGVWRFVRGCPAEANNGVHGSLASSAP